MFITISNTFSQTSYHVTTGQGLTTNQLTILIKDRQNNMWFGSYNGLHKHEGTSIKIYKKNSKDISSSLSSNEMHSLFEDRLGFIWIGTTGGLDRLDPKTQIIKHYKLKSSKRDDDWLGYIYTIFQDDKSNIWVYTQAGMFVLDYKSGSYIQILTDEKSSIGIPSAGLLYKGSLTTKTGVWMFSGGYIVFYNFKTQQFFHRFNNPENKKIFALTGGNKSELCIDSSNNLYFVFNNTQLFKYNIISEKLDSFHFDFPQNAWSCCYSLATDYKGNVWIGFRYGGILFFNAVTHQFTSIRYVDANSLIQSDYIYSLQEDYLKRMWVTTDNGIFIINYYDNVVHQKYLSNKKEFININYMADNISEDNYGNIYVPFSAGGLFKYNVFSSVSKYFPITDTSIKNYDYVYTDVKNKLFISSNGYLLQADTLKNKLILSAPSTKLNIALKAEKSSIQWMYKYNENAVYIKKANTYIYYYNGTDKLEKIATGSYTKVACVSNDHQSLYFLSKNNAIVKRDFKTCKMDSFLFVKKLLSLNFLYTNPIDIADDGKGNLWITSQNGLIKYNFKTEAVDVYTSADGLLHDLSFTLCVDSKKRLWVGTMGGINLYDEQKNSFINVFAEALGNVTNYFGSSLEAKDGHIYFLFGGKLININPDGFLKQAIEERILKLNEIQVNGKTVDYLSHDLLHLPHTENRIYFRFGLLEFSDPEKVNYSYQLKGLDKNWVELGNHSDVIFNSLQPGNYTLNVKATDGYGNVVKVQLSIPFTITPPFWKRWWFQLLTILSIIYSIYWFTKWREKNIKTIEDEKLKVQQTKTEMHRVNEQLSKAKLEALRSQMNPHFIFNSLNAIQECILTNKVDAAYEYLSKFSKLQRMVLNNSEKELILLNNEIEMLQLYLSLESLRFSKSFSYTIDTSKISNTSEIMMPSLITQPLVENAIWHGLRNKEGKKKLAIIYTEKENQIFISIDDNGIGREQAATIKNEKLGNSIYESKGTAILQQRLQVLNKQLQTNITLQVIDKKNEMGMAIGTEVILSFPSNLEK